MADNQITNGPSMLPVTSHQTLQTDDGRRDNQEKLAALTRLQSHYYQPGQSREQLTAIFQDMLEDLAHLSPAEVRIACRRYRADAANKFFPTPGQLLGAMKDKPVTHRTPPPRFDRKEFEHPNAARTLKPVGQILREHGFEAAARKWEARKA